MTMTTPPTYESIRVDTTDRVTTVTMARPDRRNAVDGPMAAELARAFTEFDDDPDADVAVLYGEGERLAGTAGLAPFENVCRTQE